MYALQYTCNKFVPKIRDEKSSVQKLPVASLEQRNAKTKAWFLRAV